MTDADAHMAAALQRFFRTVPPQSPPVQIAPRVQPGVLASVAPDSYPVFSRSWSMPSRDTFAIRPIGDFVRRYVAKSRVSVDPFARNNRLATWTNDIDPTTTADFHMDAEAFLDHLKSRSVKCDLALFDPPYSPRQISECYRAARLPCNMRETQNGRLYRRVRDALLGILTADATVLSFGWNSAGMGLGRGFRISEVMVCCHGAAHNDTICLAEVRAVSVSG